MRYIEVVDAMVGQLLRRLADAEGGGGGGGTAVAADKYLGGGAAAGEGASGGAVTRFAVCVTGDHSTPVVFGDHSHEPVPLAIAHVADVVSK